MFYEREKNKECFIKERRHKRKRKKNTNNKKQTFKARYNNTNIII